MKKNIRGWIIWITVVIVGVVITCVGENLKETPKEEPSDYQSIADSSPDSEPEVNLFEGYILPEHRTLYTKLSAEEQYIYRELYKSVLNDKYVFTLEDVEYEKYIPLLERAAYSVDEDFPEFFWLAYATKYTKNPPDISQPVKHSADHFYVIIFTQQKLPLQELLPSSW